MILTIQLAGAGSGTITSDPPGITCGKTCQGKFPLGSVVTLVAAPDPGSRLASWGGACSGTGSCAPTLTGDTTVRAEFASAFPYRMTELALPGAVAVDINGTGDVLGYRCSDAICTQSTPVIWHPQSGDVTTIDLGPSLTSATAVALNDAGAALLQDRDHGYWLYADGQAQALLPGRQVQSAHLGNQGWLAGQLATPTGPDAFLYEPDRDVLTIFGHGDYEVTSLNGAGDIVGEVNGRAVVFQPDGHVVDLGLGDNSRPVVVTEGRLVYGEGGDVYDQATGAYTPPFGFVRDLGTGETTRFGVPEGLSWDFVIDGDDRLESLLRKAELWSGGRVSTLEALSGVPIIGGVAMNSAGQILVYFSHADGSEAVGVLTRSQ